MYIIIQRFAFFIFLALVLQACGNESTTIISFNANASPSAKITPSSTNVSVGTAVTLDGSASSDPENAALQYRWSHNQADTLFSITQSLTSIARFETPSVENNTTVVITLTVTDDNGVAASTSVVIVFLKDSQFNQPPTANIASSATAVDERDSIALDGSGSGDTDGSISSYAWTQTAGTGGTLSNNATAVANFTAPSVSADTTFTFTLRITDNDGSTAQATIDIRVKNVIVRPTASIDGSVTAVNEGGNISLDGSGSGDTDGSISSYAWSQTGGTFTANTSKTSFTAPSVDVDTTFTFTLLITDNDGSTAQATIDIRVLNVNSLPTASINKSVTMVNEGDDIALDGSASTDDDGNIASYAWSQTGGTFTANTSKTSFTAPSVDVDTTFTFTLLITDNDGSTAQATIDILVKNVIVQPTASIDTSVTTVSEGGSIALDGSASTDDDGNIASYAWLQTGGTFTANTSKTSFTAPSVSADTTFTFTLLITDNDGSTAQATIDIRVLNVNSLPTASINKSVTMVYEGDGIALDGSASTDDDGNIASYAWLQTGGTFTANTSKTSFTAPSVSADTTFTFTLLVTDNDGSTAQATIDIRVLNVNSLPTASINKSVTMVNEGDGIALDGSASTDDDGNIASYAWSQTGGTFTANTSKTSFTAPSVDVDTTFTFTLLITDNDGSTAQATIDIRVLNVNSLPTASINKSVTMVNEGGSISLDGSGSGDTDGSISSYAWTQTGGTFTANTSKTSFTAPSVSADTTFTFTLLITDNDGSTAQATIDIRVLNVNSLPTASINKSVTMVNEGGSISLDGSGSTDGDGNIASYAWTQTGGTGGTLSNSAAATASFAAPSVSADTTFTFALLVTDNDGSTAQESIDIRVVNIFAAAHFTQQEGTANLALSGSLLEAALYEVYRSPTTPTSSDSPIGSPLVGSPTLNDTLAHSSAQYWVRLCTSGSAFCTDYSSAIGVRVKPLLGNDQSVRFSQGDVVSSQLFELVNAQAATMSVSVSGTSHNDIGLISSSLLVDGDSRLFAHNTTRNFSMTTWAALSNASIMNVQLRLDTLDSALSLSFTNSNLGDIYNWLDIQAMNSALSTNHQLMNNVAFPAAGSNGFTPASYTPVGTASNPFSGSLNGHGLTIANLSITNAAQANIGLFGYIHNATLQQINLTDFALTANSGLVNVGSLVGNSEDSIIVNNSVQRSTLTLNSADNHANVGGLIGLMDAGTVAANHSFAQVSVVDGTRQSAGGLIGSALNAVSIVANYTSGAISHTNPSSVSNPFINLGGLLGLCNDCSGAISDNYTQAQLNGSDPSNANIVSGGLLGYSSRTATLAALNIHNGYSSGNITQSVGGRTIGSSLSGGSAPTLQAYYGFGTLGTLTGTDSAGDANSAVTDPLGLTQANSSTLPANVWSSSTWYFGDNTNAPKLRYADYDGAGVGIDYCTTYFTLSGTNFCTAEIDGAGNLLPNQNTTVTTSTSSAGGGTTAPMTLISTAFNDGDAIPTVHACSREGGSDASPPLDWSASIPTGTDRFAVVMDDETSPCGTGASACRHWGLYNLPATVTSLVQAVDISTLGSDVVEGNNYQGSTGYAGPCPPSAHTYNITIYSLASSMPTVNSGAALTRSQFVSTYSAHILDQANLSGTFTPAGGGGGWPTWP